MEDCLFCKIVEGSIPSTKVYEDEYCYAFRDIHPQAPVHVILVPKSHVCCMNQVHALSQQEMAALFLAIQKIAVLEKVDQTGYRIVSNCGENACQSVQHLHIHLLGGAQMADKMA